MTPAETEAKSQSTSVIALAGFRVRLATRRSHDGPKGRDIVHLGDVFQRPTNTLQHLDFLVDASYLSRDSPSLCCLAPSPLPGRHPELASPPACSEHAALLRGKRQPIDRFICAWAGCDDPAFLCLCSGNKKPRQLSTPPGSYSSMPRQLKSFRLVCSEVQLRVMRSSV